MLLILIGVCHDTFSVRSGKVSPQRHGSGRKHGCAKTEVCRTCEGHGSGHAHVFPHIAPPKVETMHVFPIQNQKNHGNAHVFPITK